MPVVLSSSRPIVKHFLRATCMIRHLRTLQVSLFVKGRKTFCHQASQRGIEPDSESGAHVETFWRLSPQKSREVIENHFVVRDTLARRRFILMLVGCAPLLKSVMSLSEVSCFCRSGVLYLRVWFGVTRFSRDSRLPNNM